ncbi:MAG: radical SAM/SPASM domain-containing protein [Thermoanaerobaculia bacterium]
MTVSVWGQARQYNTDARRHHLADVLPLDGPFLVHVDPTNLCNFKCTFCPTGQPELLKDVGRPAGKMSLELFTKVVEDLLEFPSRPKVLHLYKDGEPLLHPQFGEMALRARKLGAAERINVTTNGAPLTREKIDQLLDAEIDLVRVSVEHVGDEGYRERTRTFGNYRRIVDNVRALFEERNRRGSPTRVWVKILRLGLSPEEIALFDRDFSGISDECLIMTPMGWSRTDLYDFTLGSNPTTGDNGETPLKADRVVCPYPFYSLAVNFDGTVSICCADWSHGTLVGDARTSSLREIWTGPALNEFRRRHLEDRRSEIAACASCQTMQGLPMDSDLDVDRQRLLPLFPLR